jgi:hypothetical protein
LILPSSTSITSTNTSSHDWRRVWITAAIVIAIAAVVVLIVVATGGSGGGGY